MHAFVLGVVQLALVAAAPQGVPLSTAAGEAQRHPRPWVMTLTLTTPSGIEITLRSTCPAPGVTAVGACLALGHLAGGWQGIAEHFGLSISLGPEKGPAIESDSMLGRLVERPTEATGRKFVPILGPYQEGAPEKEVGWPSEEELLKMLEETRPLAKGGERSNIRIQAESVVNYVDEPRVYPLLGPARVHHLCYKCTIFFTEILPAGPSGPNTITIKDGQEVVYFDRNHLHLVSEPSTGQAK